MIGSMEPEICMKMLGNLSKKPRANLLATACGNSMASIARLDDDDDEFVIVISANVRQNKL